MIHATDYTNCCIYVFTPDDAYSSSAARKQKYIQVVFHENKETDKKLSQSQRGGTDLLRLSVQKDEYIMVGKDVKITFLGGMKNQAHIMIDAPKEINIARGRAIEKRAATEKTRQQPEVDAIGVSARRLLAVDFRIL